MKPPVLTRLLLGAAGVGWAGLVASGCADKADEPAPATVVSRQGVTPANVTYDNYIGLLLNTRCKTCHNPASSLSTKAALDAWTNEHTYRNAADHRLKIVASIEQDNMPIARPMVAEEKALLQAWLDRGAPEK